MGDVKSLVTLAQELQELEADTFELQDYVEDIEMLAGGYASTSSTSTSACSCCA
ncbi:thiazolylpeptide-type bacteriocin [Dactylosporangium sucinum]|uniref:Thiazolylpeptide-type bacteriocin n=1 Tax=Dactylosporangium sucinum TaxID=1424081 RepID=A0A917TSI0_9ACTN|nr:thiazolylpeptide-type bacteriocin [Dactylosporangium sucinum]GGM35009.1 hypothetical protein GCM10007977_040640 [Dactylosporangium sucinum]